MKSSLVVLTLVISLLISITNTSSIPSSWKRIDLIDGIREQLPYLNNNYFIYDPINYIKSSSSFFNNNAILIQKLLSFTKEKQIKLFIILIDTITYDSLNDNIESFTSSIAERISPLLKVNEQDTIFVLFSIQDRKMRIRTGKNIVPHLDDKHCQNIIADLIPSLKSQNYHQVISILINTIINKYDTSSASIEDYLPLIIITIFFIIIGLVLLFERKKKINKKEKIKQLLMKMKTEKDVKEEECVICLERFDKKNKDENNVRTLECGHHFHAQCITDWLVKNQTCPYCRDVFDKKNELGNDKEDTQNNNGQMNITVDLLYNHHIWLNSRTNCNSNSYFSGGFSSSESSGATGSW